MAMKAWDKLNLEQKLRRIETAWRMQAEGRPPIEYASYLSPAMLKSQFNNSIEEPPPGALPQSLFDASESVRRGYTPPTGPDPPGPWSELPPQMQEGYMGGAPIPGGYDDQGARVGLDMPGQTYGQPLNAAPMVSPDQPPPMPTGNFGMGGVGPTARPMVGSQISGIQMPPEGTFQNGAQGMPPGYPDPTARYSVGNVMASPRTSPMGPAQLPTPDPINMMPQGQRIADLAVGLGNRLPQDLTNQIINQFAGSTAPVPGQTTPDVTPPGVGRPYSTRLFDPRSEQNYWSGGVTPEGVNGGLGESEVGRSVNSRLLLSKLNNDARPQTDLSMMGDMGLGRTPQGISMSPDIAAEPSNNVGLQSRIFNAAGSIRDRVHGVLGKAKDAVGDYMGSGNPLSIDPRAYKLSGIEMKSILERIELNKAHQRLAGISGARKSQLMNEQRGLESRLASLRNTFPSERYPDIPSQMVPHSQTEFPNLPDVITPEWTGSGPTGTPQKNAYDAKRGAWQTWLKESEPSYPLTIPSGRPQEPRPIFSPPIRGLN